MFMHAHRYDVSVYRHGLNIFIFNFLHELLNNLILKVLNEVSNIIHIKILENIWFLRKKNVFNGD